jgi:hypothetical protein
VPRLVPVALVILSALSCTIRAGTTGQRVPTSAEAITEIALERRCFGCDRELAITIRRDGTATRTTFGNARMGVAERQAHGEVPGGAFDELSRLVVAEGFATLNEEYRDPSIADGEWAVTAVTSGGVRKSVLDKHEKAPPALVRIQARIEALGKTIVWK